MFTAVTKIEPIAKVTSAWASTACSPGVSVRPQGGVASPTLPGPYSGILAPPPTQAPDYGPGPNANNQDNKTNMPPPPSMF